MALHNLKIVVIDGGKSGSYKSKNAGLNNKEDEKTNYKDTKLYKLLNAKMIIKNKVQSRMTQTQAFAMDMGVKLGVQAVKQTANYFLTDIGRKHGDSNYQAIINRKIEMYADPLSVLGGMWSGATIGSVLGPLGAGLGAIAGGMSSAISLGFKYAERDRAFQHEMFKENTSQAYHLARSSFQGFTGRLR